MSEIFHVLRYILHLDNGSIGRGWVAGRAIRTNRKKPPPISGRSREAVFYQPIGIKPQRVPTAVSMVLPPAFLKVQPAGCMGLETFMPKLDIEAIWDCGTCRPHAKRGTGGDRSRKAACSNCPRGLSSGYGRLLSLRLFPAKVQMPPNSVGSRPYCHPGSAPRKTPRPFPVCIVKIDPGPSPHHFFRF